MGLGIVRVCGQGSFASDGAGLEELYMGIYVELCTLGLMGCCLLDSCMIT